MAKIRKYTRTITETEFLKLKKLEPFATYRQESKACNFSFLFGASFKRFSQNSLETAWSEERVKEFCVSRKLEADVEAMREKYPKIEEKFLYYYSASDYIRTSFFKAYPGLGDRIKRNENFAKEHGYVRSYHGAIRRTPLLMWCLDPNEVDGRSGLLRVRKDEDYKEMAGLINITANTTIQNDEVCDMNMAIVRWMNDPDNEENAPIFGMVHDSSDFYILRELFREKLQSIKEVFEKKDNDWQQGINFAIEGAIVDFLKEGAYYKHGEVVIK